jgi:hypothetical protein
MQCVLCSVCNTMLQYRAQLFTSNLISIDLMSCKKRSSMCCVMLACFPVTLCICIIIFLPAAAAADKNFSSFSFNESTNT